jgi:hypothetical protein
MDLIQTAKFWIAQNISVIPIKYYSKKPFVSKLQNGKWESYQKKAPSHTELLAWFASKLTNIAVVVGNGLVVIDFDIQEVFDYWYSQIKLNTFMVKTRRGVHVYIRTMEPAKNYHNKLLDVKAERGYVLTAPSIHPSGFEYKVICDAPVMTVQKLSDVLPIEYTPEPEKIEESTMDQTQYVGGEMNSVDPWDLAFNAIEINKSLIEEIKAHVKIIDILPAEQSSTDGQWWVALCPFHDDHTPSFWIDTYRGLCGCRKCNIKEMDVINLYARLHNISNLEAIRQLATHS